MSKNGKWQIAVMICVAASMLYSNSIVAPVFASTLAELREEQEKTKDELDKANEQVAGLKDEKNEIESEIKNLDDELVTILASVSMLEEEVSEKQKEIDAVQLEYEAALELEQEQNRAMMVRIKCMYEKGDASYLEIFINARNFGDMLNKANYVEQLYEYDRNLLLAYQETKNEVLVLKETLELESEELLATMSAYEEEQSSLDAMLREKEAEAEDYELLLSKAQQEAAAYKLKVEQQTAKINKLIEEERLKALQNNVSQVPATVITNAKGSALGKEIALYAVKFLGNPYVYGGTSLTNGTDCSGFTSSVYRAFGYQIPRTSTEQRSAGKGISYSDVQPGDLICYSGHVGLYIGNNQVVHASSPSTGIIISSAAHKPILAIRRII